MSTTFKTKIRKIGNWNIVSLPKDVSSKLSSRGLTMIAGTINGLKFQTELEPDGKGSHWFRVDKPMMNGIKAKESDSVTIVFDQVTEWPNPIIPDDLRDALNSNRSANDLWNDITPLAKWEWIRWIRSTKNPETRKKRIVVASSKLNSGKRRPCCFNSNQCTVPEVSSSGILMELE